MIGTSFIEPVSIDFEPSLWPHNADIENYRSNRKFPDTSNVQFENEIRKFESSRPSQPVGLCEPFAARKIVATFFRALART